MFAAAGSDSQSCLDSIRPTVCTVRCTASRVTDGALRQATRKLYHLEGQQEPAAVGQQASGGLFPEAWGAATCPADPPAHISSTTLPD